MQKQAHIKTRPIALAVAALMLGAVIGLPNAGVATDPLDASAFGPPVTVGHLALQLRTSSSGVVSGQVLQYDAGTPASVIDTQTFSVTRCEVTTDGRLLRFESSSGKVGLYNNGLGTKVKGTCSPAEGRTGPGPDEIFTVSLGTKFDGTPVSIDSSEFDIEGKFSVNMLWSAFMGSTPEPVATGSANVLSSSDNGPDAGTGDNSIVTIGSKDDASDNYTSLRLSTAQGEFGLDGGGDGTYPTQNSLGTNDSILFLSSSAYPYTVDCGDLVEATQSELALSDSAGDDSVVSQLALLRLANKDAGECTPIGVTVSASDAPGRPDEAYVDHSVTSQSVRARVKIVWIVQMAGKTQAEIDLELAREVVFVVGQEPVPVSNCLDVPDGVGSNPLDPTSTAVIDHPDDAPWCLMSDSRVVSGNTIIQTHYYSGNGDPRFF